MDVGKASGRTVLDNIIIELAYLLLVMTTNGTDWLTIVAQLQTDPLTSVNGPFIVDLACSCVPTRRDYCYLFIVIVLLLLLLLLPDPGYCGLLRTVNLDIVDLDRLVWTRLVLKAVWLDGVASPIGRTPASDSPGWTDGNSSCVLQACGLGQWPDPLDIVIQTRWPGRDWIIDHWTGRAGLTSGHCCGRTLVMTWLTDRRTDWRTVPRRLTWTDGMSEPSREVKPTCPACGPIGGGRTAQAVPRPRQPVVNPTQQPSQYERQPGGRRWRTRTETASQASGLLTDVGQALASWTAGHQRTVTPAVNSPARQPQTIVADIGQKVTCELNSNPDWTQP